MPSSVYKNNGIAGGGQLGRMLAIAGKKLGFTIIVLDPTAQSPAGQVADKQIVGNFTDEKKIIELANQTDFLTFEIELTNAAVLEDLEKKGININPSPKTLSIIKDKLRQKEFLRNAGIPAAEFIDVPTPFPLPGRGDSFPIPSGGGDKGVGSLHKDVLQAAKPSRTMQAARQYTAECSARTAGPGNQPDGRRRAFSQ